MTVPYVGAEAVIVETVAGWLAAAESFQNFTGTADAETAAEHIVEIEGDVDPIVAHAIIDTPALRLTRTPGGGHDGTADVAIVFAGPGVDGDTEAEAHRRALNNLAALRRDLLAVGEQRILSVSSDPPVMLDPSDDLPVWVEFVITLTIEVAP